MTAKVDKLINNFVIAIVIAPVVFACARVAKCNYAVVVISAPSWVVRIKSAQPNALHLCHVENSTSRQSSGDGVWDERRRAISDISLGLVLSGQHPRMPLRP